MSLEKRLAFFTEARHALGKSALLLSGGLGLGMYHLGVVRALHEQNLLPRIISASSFGAVVAAVVSTKTVEELSVMFDKLFEQEGNICACLHQAQQDSTYVKVRRLFSKGLMPLLPRPPYHTRSHLRPALYSLGLPGAAVASRCMHGTLLVDMPCTCMCA